MKKEKPCRHCYGTGKETVQICDNCKTEQRCGEFEGKEICQNCWADILEDRRELASTI